MKYHLCYPKTWEEFVERFKKGEMEIDHNDGHTTDYRRVAAQNGLVVKHSFWGPSFKEFTKQFDQRMLIDKDFFNKLHTYVQFKCRKV